MASLEDLVPGVIVRGLLPQRDVTVKSVLSYSGGSIELIYTTSDGALSSQLLNPQDIAQLELLENTYMRSFSADGSKFRLVSEAYRIRLAALFDPLLAVSTSQIDPLPHQITAVYEKMLPRNPLRFLLADDPGAGKTIMAGLLIKELMMRSDAQRVCIVVPGNLTEQWQDELKQRFQLDFELLGPEHNSLASSGAMFEKLPLCIARMDRLARSEELQKQLEQSEWDLVIVDEAHKMSASFYGGEAHYTKRHRLGKLLGSVTKHLLLLTATPHNGKEDDFQLFLSLLDQDRFEYQHNVNVTAPDISDCMRRLVKEQLCTFEGKPLFPERKAYTLSYKLTILEEHLYKRVTEYVRGEFNRAEQLETGRKTNITFALTVLQRRLASSPEAISQSLTRRRNKLEMQLADLNSIHSGERLPVNQLNTIDEDDLDEASDDEIVNLEDDVINRATASQTMTELRAEIALLKELERLAGQVLSAGKDSKWESVSELLQNEEQMFDDNHRRLKLIIFTEHRDTLLYLHKKICALLGKSDSAVIIHGGINRAARDKAREMFVNNKDTLILIATDAAGEGINLQRAHLMINYDLPWNPNRLEQRFGRIHRIGQKDVCHMWNLVSMQTREGEVFQTLFKKLEEERNALGGGVFDVLGKIEFENKPLRDLIIQAIRYGDDPVRRRRLDQIVETAFAHEHVQKLLEQHALMKEMTDVANISHIRDEMERAAARRMQPHFICAFFLEAIKQLGGQCIQIESKRYEVTRTPPVLSNYPQKSLRTPIVRRYERVVFEKELIDVHGKPQAILVTPGHPLLDTAIDVILENYENLFSDGTVLVDPEDIGRGIRILLYIEHAIYDGLPTNSGKQHVVSRQLQFVEMREDGSIASAGYAPFLNYRPLEVSERELIASLKKSSPILRDAELRAKDYAITHIAAGHLEATRKKRYAEIDKIYEAVNQRLTAEISYWNNRAALLKKQIPLGKQNAAQNAAQAEQKSQDLLARLTRRLETLKQERTLSSAPPVILSAALIAPQGLIDALTNSGNDFVVVDPKASEDAAARRHIELAAMRAVMDAELALGNEPRDVSAEKCGYDIESRQKDSGKLRFIEVKGRIPEADTIIVTKNEILTALNKPDEFILAVVRVPSTSETATQSPYVRYISRPFIREPDFAANSVTYNLRELLDKSYLPK